MHEMRQGVFGIDLGTTYSVVAYIDDAGKPVIARNGSGEETTPSVILFETEENIPVGAVAKESAVVTPDSVVALVKREMGSAEFVRTFFGNRYSAPALSALILQAVAAAAQEDSGRTVSQVVITVPAYFGMIEKAATQQAGELAGLDVVGIVPEPVAAALAYGLGTEADGRTVLVYDLGGGTFDVTIIRISADEIRVLAVDGHSRLGGADWDEVLLDHLVTEIVAEVGDDSIRDDDYAMQELANQAEKTKRALSSKESVPVSVRQGGTPTRVTVTRAQFEEMTRDLLKETIEITQRVLDIAEGLHPGTREAITDVLLVGGSSIMPAVRTALASEFGWEPRLADPHLAVAKGAALYAAGQCGRVLPMPGPADDDLPDTPGDSEPLPSPAMAVTDEEKRIALTKAAEQLEIDEKVLEDLGRRTVVSALPKAIGISLIDTAVSGWNDASRSEPPRYIHHLVDAQTEVPLRQAVTFPGATAFANAPGVRIEIWEQAGAVAGREISENRFLADGEIEGLGHLNLPAGSPVEILFTVDENGVAVVNATEPASGQRLRVEAKIELLDREAMQTAKKSLEGLVART